MRKEVKEEEEKFLIRVAARSSCFSTLQNLCMHALLYWFTFKFTHEKVHTRLKVHHSLQSAAHSLHYHLMQAMIADSQWNVSRLLLILVRFHSLCARAFDSSNFNALRLCQRGWTTTPPSIVLHDGGFVGRWPICVWKYENSLCDVRNEFLIECRWAMCTTENAEMWMEEWKIALINLFRGSEYGSSQVRARRSWSRFMDSNEWWFCAAELRRMSASIMEWSTYHFWSPSQDESCRCGQSWLGRLNWICWVEMPLLDILLPLSVKLNQLEWKVQWFYDCTINRRTRNLQQNKLCNSLLSL